jgi:hypothetical protein
MHHVAHHDDAYGGRESAAGAYVRLCFLLLIPLRGALDFCVWTALNLGRRPAKDKVPRRGSNPGRAASARDDALQLRCTRSACRTSRHSRVRPHIPLFRTSASVCAASSRSSPLSASPPV